MTRNLTLNAGGNAVTPSISVNAHLAPAAELSTPPVLSTGRQAHYQPSSVTSQSSSNAFQRQTRHRQTFHGMAGKASPVNYFLKNCINFWLTFFVEIFPMFFVEKVEDFS